MEQGKEETKDALWYLIISDEVDSTKWELKLIYKLLATKPLL